MFRAGLSSLPRCGEAAYRSREPMRATFRQLTCVAAMLGAAACGDTATGPQRTAPREAGPLGSPVFDMSGGNSLGDQTGDFTLTPQGGSFPLKGLFTLSFPPNSVCDPAQSNYADWGQDCIRLQDNVQVHVQLRITATGMAVDFSPEIRFAPSAGPVTISTDAFASVITANKSFFATYPSFLQVLAMSYAPALGAAAVADYKLDPALVTHVNLSTGKVWRVIWHFSGYLVAAGDAPCDPSQGVTCIAVDSIP